MFTNKYIRKPFEVTGVRVTAENMEEVAKWCGGQVLWQAVNSQPAIPHIKVNVTNAANERQTMAFVGDWVLSGRGFKVYTDKAFRDSFDLVQTDEAKNELAEKLNAFNKEMAEFEATFLAGIMKIRDFRLP